MLITTKFMGPTNTRGARIKATSASGKSIFFPWEPCAGIDDNHAAAAEHLERKLVVDGALECVRFVRRWSKDGTCVHVGLYEHELKGE
jgi:hypothetical protein